MAETSPENLLRLSAQIVSAHVTRTAVTPEALPALIRDVHAALAGVGQAAPPPPDAPQPAVPVRRSIQPDHLVCLEDGAHVTMLKRYIATRFGLTPDQYRAKWGLPRDYPMTAPDYARRRSVLAKSFGLGRPRSSKAEPGIQAEAAEVEATVEATDEVEADDAPDFASVAGPAARKAGRTQTSSKAASARTARDLPTPTPQAAPPATVKRRGRPAAKPGAADPAT